MIGMETTILHVGGAKGVGKTRLLSEFEGTRINGKDICVAHISGLLRSAAKERSWDWADLSNAERSCLRFEVIDRIRSMRRDVIVLDSHYVELREGEFKTIFPDEFKSEMDGHIVVEARIATILSRRIYDKTVKRVLDPVSIGKEMVAERNAATAVAEETNTPVRIVDNASLGSALRAFRDVVEIMV